jgi:hypothetical protein
MKNKLLIIVITLFLCTIGYSQNRISISGFIYDGVSGEVLIGANIYEKNTGSGAASNEYGFYSLTINTEEKLQLSVSFIGYESQDTVVSSKKSQTLDFNLKPGLVLSEVNIEAERTKTIVERTETGVVRLQISEIKQLPNLFGEVDIIKAYQLTPGVQSGGEAKSNIYVRGGSPDQNLILLDDVPLYYVAHFGGFFSVFNADAINDVKLIKGGFPARYGGRLSSVLDIRMKEGHMREYQGQGTIGLLSSKLSYEGPIIKDKSSFIVSARKNLIPIFRFMGTGISYNFYDINAKVNYRISEKDRLFLSFYTGDDLISSSQKAKHNNTKNVAQWGNTLTAFRWNRVYNSKLFSNLTLSNTYYRYKNIFEYQMNIDSISRDLHSSLLTGINDLSLKMDFSYNYNPRLSFRFGANSIYHRFIPNDEVFKLSGTSMNSINQTYDSELTAFENSVYLENEFKINRISANIGARYTSYYTERKLYHYLEPRAILNFILREDIALKYSFSESNQFVHLLSYSGSGMPSDYWMPSNSNVKPQNSVQNSLGIAKTFKQGVYELSIETYHKTFENLIDFKPGASLLGNLDSWENVIEQDGIGQNYGVELFLQKIKGRTTGWIGVTISKAERQFEQINNGEVYPYVYDRLLDFSIVINHRLTKNISLSATWTYGSGYPITLATEIYNINDEDIFIYGDKNSFRMRDYHRLDISANFTKETTWGERNWTISVFNVYNRQNPYYYYYEYELVPVQGFHPGNPYTYGDLKLRQRSLFGIFPSIAYSFKF